MRKISFLILVSCFLSGCAVQESTYVDGLGTEDWKHWPIERIVERYGYNTDGCVIYYIYRKPPDNEEDSYEKTPWGWRKL